MDDGRGLNFTEAAIRRLERNVGTGEIDGGHWRDTGTKVGLWVRVGPRGAVFKSIVRRHGRKVTETIGPLATVSVKTARERATLIATKKPPDPRRQGYAGRGLDCQAVFDEYLQTAKAGTFAPGRKPITERTVISYVEAWRPHVQPEYGHRNLVALAADIGEIHERLADRPGVQKKLMQVVKNVFEHAIRKKYWVGQNPVIDAATGKAIACVGTQDRERFLNETELETFIEYAKNAEAPWGDFYMLALVTGQRLSKLLGARWSDIDLSKRNASWRIGVTKNGAPLVVPLLDDAVALLKHRKASLPKDELFVFPSPRSESGHLERPYARWAKMLEETGITDLRIHDLRRTCGTIAVRENSLPAVARYLGQRTLRAVMVYARAGDSDARKVGSSVASALRHASGASPIRET